MRKMPKRGVPSNGALVEFSVWFPRTGPSVEIHDLLIKDAEGQLALVQLVDFQIIKPALRDIRLAGHAERMVRRCSDPDGAEHEGKRK